MKKLISLSSVFVFFLLLSNFLIAQPEVEKAKVALDKLSQQTKGYTTIKAVFSYNLKNKDAGIDETQEGTIHIKGNKYKLDIAGQQVLSDGKAMWTYIKDVNEVQINNLPDPKESEDIIDPSQIFTLYEKGFKYKSQGNVKLDGKTLHQINLFPIDSKGKSYHTVKLFIDETKNQLSSINIVGKDGNTYTYSVKNLTPNVALEDKFFIFDKTKFPGVDVVDLR